MTLHTKIYALGAGLLVLVGGADLALAPKTVTISSKDWVCVETTAFGIEARCVGYKHVRELGR
jgi:hypothetical protein